MRKSALIAFCWLFFFPFGVHAQSLEPLFQTVCQEAGASIDLAMAIARHESGMNPYAINVAGRSHQPRSREEAERIIRDAHRAGKSYDVGFMQVNSSWVARWRIAPESLRDPETNIRAGVKILTGEIGRYGFT